MEYIYCYINKINSHKYVGQTNNLKRRQNEHWSNANNPDSQEYNLLFHRKLREYGKENFEFIVLEKIDSDDLNLINKQEKYWIKKLNTYVAEGEGYNMTYGGDNNEHSRIYSSDIIQKVKSEIKQGISYEEIHKRYQISIGYISGINTGYYFFDENEIYPLYKYYQTKKDLEEIIDLLQNTTIPMTEIAKLTNKAYSTIKKINSGNLQYNPNLNYPIRKISSTQEKANKIKQMLMEGSSNQEIVDSIGVSLATIKRINSGETHYDKNLNYPLRKPVSTI